MKQSAVFELCMRQASAQSVAQALGVSRPSLYNCKCQLFGHEASAPMKRKGSYPSNSERAELERQGQTLEQDIRRLRLEHDLLNKAK